MNRISHILIIHTVALFLLSSCVGVTHNAYYKGPIDPIKEDAILVKDDAKKFNFMLPAGWVEVAKNEKLPDTLAVPLDNANETGIAVYRKGNRGSIVVWCRAMGQTDYIVEQSLYKISPSSVMVKGPLQIKSSGWNPDFRRYDSSIIEKGEKKGFSFFFGTKMQALTSLYGCHYNVVARSATLEDTEEIERDFISVLKSLKN